VIDPNLFLKILNSVFFVKINIIIHMSIILYTRIFIIIHIMNNYSNQVMYNCIRGNWKISLKHSSTIMRLQNAADHHKNFPLVHIFDKKIFFFWVIAPDYKRNGPMTVYIMKTFYCYRPLIVKQIYWSGLGDPIDSLGL